jgi:transposase
MNKLVLPDGHQFVVELIRIYPDSETHAKLRAMKEEVRHVWNECVREREHVKQARTQVVLKNNLVPIPPPQMPTRPSLPRPETEDQKQQVRQAWKEYRNTCQDKFSEWSTWYKLADKAVKDMPELSWRNTPYQHFRSSSAVGNAVLFRDTVKRFRGTKRAQFKREHDHVPLVWCNSPKVKTGTFYGLRRGVPWYDALVSVNGMRIPGRLRRPLPGKQVQGVTLVRCADGWYAAVKCIVPCRALAPSSLPPIGVDVGQTDLVAASDGYRKHNERTAQARMARAALQSVADLSREPQQIQIARQKIARLDQKSKRRVVHWLHTELLPKLEQHEFVAVEKLQKNFKSNKGSLSYMHSTLDAIKLRLGDRVREVECAYTSQTCSQCGNVDKSARDRKHFSCVIASCGHTQDADINAARNILARGLKQQSLQ